MLPVALAAALLAAAPPAPAAASSGPCKLGDALYAAGLFKEAALEYHAVARGARARRTARSAAALSCAHKGLGSVEAVRHVRAAQIGAAIDAQNKSVRATARAPTRLDEIAIPRLIRDRIVDAASVGREDLIPRVVAREVTRDHGLYGIAIAQALDRAHYPLAAAAVVTATVDAHPPVPLPARLRALVDQRRAIAAKREIDAATAYAQAGFDVEAHAAVKRAIELDPDVSVPYEVREPNHNVTWWNWVRGRFGPWVRTFVEAVIAIAVVLLLLAVVARAIVRLPGRFRVRPVVEQFTGDPKEAGPPTTAAVRENCAKLRGDGGYRLKTVVSSGESFEAIPRELGEVYKPAGTAVDLLNALARFVPSRTRRITGQVRPYDSDRGVGLTVTFGRHGNAFGEQTVWERDFGTPLDPGGRDPGQQSYDCVALPAAVWLTFVAANRTVGRRLRARIGRGRPFTAVGTADWRSYAHFAVGSEQQGNGQDDVAVQAYYRALGIDPRNRGAALNLGTLELQRPEIAIRRSGLDRLGELHAASGDDRADEQWYRVRYCETVGRLDPELAGYASRAATSTTAVESAVGLCAEMLDQLSLDRPRSRRERRRPGADPLFLRTVLPSALLTLASALQQAGRPAADVPLDAAGLRERLRAYAHDRGAHEAFDAAVTHSALVRFVAEALPEMELGLNADARYNLACYKARVAGTPPETPGRWEDAERELFEAIQRGGRAAARWATADPALERFRADDGRRERLWSVVDEVRA